MSYFSNDRIQRASKELGKDNKMSLDSFYGEILERMEKEETDTILGSVNLALLQNINFWNRAYSDEFVRNMGELKHLYSMDATLMAGRAVGELSDVMENYNEGLTHNPKYAIDSEEKLQHEKIESATADLVIAAIRLAQENEIDLGKAVTHRIAQLTGVNMGVVLKQAIVELMMQAQQEESEDEADTE